MTQRILDYRLLKERRNEYGVSQNKLATACGLSRSYLNQIENGGVTASTKTMRRIFDQLESFNPDLPLTLLFDYVRIRFPTTDVGKLFKKFSI